MKRFNLLISCIVVFFTLFAQITSAANYADLTFYQKQKYWNMWQKDCQQLLLNKQYANYRTCALNVLDKASKIIEGNETWCNDSDNGIDFFTKGVVTSDLYPNGKADYSYTFPNGKTYVMEGACNKNKKYYTIQKICAELGNYKEKDGVCVIANHAPQFEQEALPDSQIEEGNIFTLQIGATDEDGDKLEFYAENLPDGATFKNGITGGGLFEWQPTYEQSGEYEITFYVSDGKLKDSVKVKIIVADKNQTPTIMMVMNADEVNEGEKHIIDLYATDKDGDKLEFWAENLPEGSMFDKDVPIPFPQQWDTKHAVFSWTPNYQQAGEYKITFYVSDSKDQYSLSAQVTVVDVNQAPILNPIGDKTVKEGEELKFEVTGSDGDGDTITYFTNNLPSGATFTGQTFSWTPNYQQSGEYKVSFSVYDGIIKTTQDIKITVNEGEPSLIWNKNFGGVEYNGFEDVVKTADNDYVVVGTTMIMDSNDPHIWAAKIDSNGNVVWNKIYQKSPNDAQSGYDIELAGDGGYVIVGDSSAINPNGVTQPAQAVINKIDDSGELIWSKKIGQDGYKMDGEVIMKSSNGGYAVTSRICPNQGGLCNVLLTKINNNGDIEWQKTYKSSLPNGSDAEIHSGSVTEDGGYILGATTSNAVDGQQFWLIKTDKDGNIGWQNYYGDQYYQKQRSIKQTSDGGYIAVGYTQVDNGNGLQTDIWVVKVDSNGNKQWDKNFGGPNSDDGTDVIQASDGGFVVAGRYNEGQTGSGWVIKTDASGNKEWDFKNTAGVDSNMIYGITQNDDGSYIFVGAAGTFKVEANQGWIFKLK